MSPRLLHYDYRLSVDAGRVAGSMGGGGARRLKTHRAGGYISRGASERTRVAPLGLCARLAARAPPRAIEPRGVPPTTQTRLRPSRALLNEANKPSYSNVRITRLWSSWQRRMRLNNSPAWDLVPWQGFQWHFSQEFFRNFHTRPRDSDFSLHDRDFPTQKWVNEIYEWPRSKTKTK